MPRIKLTKSAIDALPIPESDLVHWDIGLPGFGVKVTPKGRKVFSSCIVLEEPAQSSANIPSVHTDM